jgi:chromosome partitioning protein
MMTKVYALANQKGGVGKTTTAVNLGAYLTASGERVLLVDVDPQANATSSLGIDKNKLPLSIYDVLINNVPLAKIITLTNRLRLDIAPSSPPLAGAQVEIVRLPGREHLLRKSLIPILDCYDYVLIDSPPSLGLLTVNALTAAADGVIIPIQCEYLALEGLTQLIHTINLVRENLNPRLTVAGILMTMYDVRTKLSQQVVDEVRKHFGSKVFSTVIPRSVRLSEAPSYGETILGYAPRSAGALAYQALAEEFLNKDRG